ncbi:hypothetical protein QYE76_060983 [Lolium multiflorum]|uniref:F-box domain-containing protein n=1 Tax=Lolium multiflorum TaxID=4521 RepID=A0AAD8S1F3_LOLMU|nr:hypothetical protein QYE76_060983 [Lolium multiflorum]
MLLREYETQSHNASSKQRLLPCVLAQQRLPTLTTHRADARLAPIQPWRGGGDPALRIQMLGWFKRDRKPQQGMSTSVLPDELVVDILSRLPLKSVCRFKCVCKSWLAFSSHPYYRQKLPRTPAGLLYRQREPIRLPWSLGTSIHLASLPGNGSEVDTRLNFVPLRYKNSNLEDCSNGLLLCYQGGGHKREEISNAIVSNPATQEWMALPNTEPGPPVCSTDLRLCFDPLWSQHFYVFKFQSIPHLTPHIGTTTEVEHLWLHEILALDAPDTSAQGLNSRIIQLPGFANDMFNCCDGCLCQASSVLCYAKQEIDGCVVRIWSLEGPDKWVVKHRVRMTDVFGRDNLLSTDTEGYWYFDYDILAFDMERELVILEYKKADKIISVSISTGKGSRFVKIPKKFTELYRSIFYVPYYGEVPALVR